MARTAEIRRSTAETKIEIAIDLDGSGLCDVSTGVGFFDHMLAHLARHALIDLVIKADGDLHIDAHHTVEDVGICLGQALRQAFGDKSGIRRYGHSTLPMDETLVTAAVDLSGRACFVWKVEVPNCQLGNFNSELGEEFWRAVANAGALNLHVVAHHGRNVHHILEAVFKACARALRMAVEPDARRHRRAIDERRVVISTAELGIACQNCCRSIADIDLHSSVTRGNLREDQPNSLP